MATRIRYTKSGDFLHSKPILAGTQLVVVTLNKITPGVLLINYDTGAVIQEAQATTLAKRKALAKQCLVELGASFEAEVRRSNDSESPF